MKKITMDLWTLQTIKWNTQRASSGYVATGELRNNGARVKSMNPLHLFHHLQHSSAQGTGISVKREREEHDDLKICERCDQSFTDANNSNDARTYHTCEFVTLMEVSLDVPQGLTEQRVIRR